MNDKEFRAFLDLLMCSDPWPVCDGNDNDNDNQNTIKNYADRESQDRGYDDWVHAYHNF